MNDPIVRRGAVVRLGNPAGSGEPRRRLAVVVQAGRWLAEHPTLLCCPLTSTALVAPLLRLPLRPSAANGLQRPLQLMVDKLFAATRQQLRQVLGVLDGEDQARLDLALRQWLDLP